MEEPRQKENVAPSGGILSTGMAPSSSAFSLKAQEAREEEEEDEFGEAFAEGSTRGNGSAFPPLSYREARSARAEEEEEAAAAAAH